MTRFRFRSSVIGMFVTRLFAKLFPRETQRETVDEHEALDAAELAARLNAARIERESGK